MKGRNNRTMGSEYIKIEKERLKYVRKFRKERVVKYAHDLFNAALCNSYCTMSKYKEIRE